MKNRLTNIASKFILCIAFWLLQNLHAQETLLFNFEDNQEITFSALVQHVESISSYSFYYQDKELEELDFVAKSNSTISKLLEQVLGNTTYNFYIDDSKNILIYSGKKIREDLPDYSTNYKSVITIKTNLGDSITVSEKKYIRSQKLDELELISVGIKQSGNSEQTKFVTGRIIDFGTGEALVGATVFVKDLKIGAASDLDGYFNIALKPGKYLVIANCMSMREKKFYLEVNDNGTISIPLEKSLISISEVTVVADRHDNVRGMQMGYERISTKNIKEIPAVLGEKDLLKVAQMLPGVQSAGEGASGINVRGGTADQNHFFINKLPIYNTSHLFGFFTAFSPDVVNDFTLYKSNMPAKYGGRVSSVFDITTRQGNKKSFFGQGGISPITAHIALEGPVVKDKSAIVLSYRGSYSDWLLSQTNNINLQNSKASFYDLSAGINTEINKKNIVKIFGYKSNDKFSLAASDDYNYYNTGGVISLKHFFSSSLKSDFTLLHSIYGFGHNNKGIPSGAYRHEYELKHSELKADFVLLNSKNHRFSFGLSSILYNLHRGNVNPYNDSSNFRPISMGDESAIESAVYVSDEFALLPRLSLLIGLRYSFYMLLGPSIVNEYYSNSPIDENNIETVAQYNNNQVIQSYSGPEPRAALNYRVGQNNAIKASYNRMRQYIFMLSNTIAISPTDQWKLADYHLKPPIFDQVSIGYYHDFPKLAISSSIEAYKKWGKNIVEYRDGADFISPKPIEMQLLQGTQDSYGIELMLKKNAGKLTGWLAYCYSHSTIQVSNSIPSEEINYGKKYPSNFDRPHSLNLITNLRSSRRLSFSANVVYSTGRPISYPVASYESEGVEMLHYSGRNEYRIPDYFRIDFSINLEGNLNKKKWLHSYWMLNIYNLTGRKNAYSVYFETTNGQIQGYKLSVFGQPIITLSWNFKFGNYVSE